MEKENVTPPSAAKAPAVIIEAPSRAQIDAAKRMRRQLTLPSHDPSTPETKRQTRYYTEGILLMLMGGGLAWYLIDLGQLALIIGAVLFAAGLIVMLRSHRG